MSMLRGGVAALAGALLVPALAACAQTPPVPSVASARPSPSVVDSSVAATPTPTPIPFPAGSRSTVGRYIVRVPHVPLQAALRLGPGWTSGGWYVRDNEAAVAFFVPESVNRDACERAPSLPARPLGRSVAEFLRALDRQRNSRMSQPRDTAIGEVPAKRLQLRPSDSAPCAEVHWWYDRCCGDPAYRGARVNDENPDTVWIVNVDGYRVAIVGYWDHRRRANGDAVRDIVASIEFVS